MKISQKMVFVCAVFFLVCCRPEGGNATPPIMPRDQIIVQKADSTEYLFFVELAMRHTHQEYGLMNRTSLPENAGMLFIFGEEEKRTFWMKNTLIPLDMLFISKDGQIKHIHHNAKPMDETSITSRHPAMAVLEINGGLADRYGIKEGDKVLFKAFNNVHLEEHPVP